MPRFFIHSRRGGEIVRDVEGQELPGLEAAQAAATATIRELLADEIKHAKGPTLEAMIIATRTDPLPPLTPDADYQCPD